MRRWAEHMASTDASWEHLRQAELGTPDEQVTTVLDTRAHLQQRIAAMAEHRSQRSPFEGLPQELFEDFLTSEHLIRVRPPGTGGPPETQLGGGARPCLTRHTASDDLQNPDFVRITHRFHCLRPARTVGKPHEVGDEVSHQRVQRCLKG